MAGKQEQRLRHLIAGAQLDAAIDAELDQWKNAKERLYKVGEALIDVSTPVSENLGQATVTSALKAFKQVGEKVNDRADDIDAIYQALNHAVSVTRHAQSTVASLDGDQRDQPTFPPSKPGDDEADEVHNLKVYMSQSSSYDLWAGARESKAQEHADKVESAWTDAIAVMEKVPDDQTSGGGPGGGGGTTGPTGPIVPTTTAPTGPTTTHHTLTSFTPTQPPPPVHWVPPTHPPQPPQPTIPDEHGFPPAHVPTTTPTGPHTPTYEPPPVHPGHPGPGGGLDPYPGTTTPTSPGAPVPTGASAPPTTLGPGSLSGLAVGGVAGAGLVGGLNSGLRGSGLTGGAGGLRGGGTLGATGRTAGSTRGSLGARSGAGAGGAASGRGTGRGGSSGAAGRRGAGAGAGGAGRGKGKDKKKQAPVVELFDEDKDWIDDEGASSGVID